MLKRIYRLPAAHRLVSSKTFVTPLFLVKVSTNELPYNRFGFVTTKRTIKNAVNRNRTKRRVRAHIELLLEQFTQGHDVLFFFKKDLTEVSIDQIIHDVEMVCKKAGLLI